jgi:large subunit ribosomal protein L10
MQGLRRSLPKEGAKILVCKNTLLRRAADTVDGWTELKPAAKGDNAWLFIEEEQIAEGVKAYLGFKQGLIKALPKDQQEDFKLMALSGGAMDGKALAPADILRLEKLPTKLQLIAKIANLLNQVPTKLAVSIKQVPTKVALGVKALADADEDKAKIVGDVCKPEAA